MAQKITHRGPDDWGMWFDHTQSMRLAHTRLAILDTSSQGHQPMVSHDGRYLITYNGEIYNFPELKKELANSGFTFRGDSDTEVLLAAIQCRGLEKTLSQISGMFAFALWDQQERALSLVRDRICIKPLYYGWYQNIFIFASELHPLKTVPGFNPKLDLNSTALFLRYGCIPAPWSIYQGIFKLPAGHLLQLKPASGEKPTSRPYWSARAMAINGRQNPFRGSLAEGERELEERLTHTIKAHMVSDVPIGCFLSGGIDSSLVTALMQKNSSRPVKTFSIGLQESGYNEADFARQTAKYLNTDHTELILDSAQVMSEIPSILSLLDEPFADSSQIPTYYVNKLARTQVTVALSGDGGDELFCGYNRYIWAEKVLSLRKRWGRQLSQLLGFLIQQLPPQGWNNLYALIAPLLSDGLQMVHPGAKLHNLAKALTVENHKELYRSLISLNQRPTELVPGSQEPQLLWDDEPNWKISENFSEQMMLLDLLGYLPDDILTKVDRASMGHSLEARVPLLDHQLATFAWSLPLHFKRRGNQGKLILRNILYKHLPRAMMERPKTGFGIPVGKWLRADLRDWAEDLLIPEKLEANGLNPRPLVAKWQRHLAGQGNLEYHLWSVLIYQHWRQTGR